MSAPVTSTPRPPAPTTRQQLDELDALLQRMMDLPVSQADPEATPAPPVAPRPRPQPAPPPRPAAPSRKAYPPSYMVVESSAPSFAPPAPPPEEPLEPPTPGGRHQLVEDDPMGELAKLRARLEREEETPSDWVPLRSSWQPSAQTWKPLAETWEQSKAPPPPEPRPAHGPRVQTREAPPPVVVATSPAPQATPPTPPPLPPATKPRRPVILWPLVAFNVVFDVFLWPLGPLGTWLKRPAGRSFLGTIGLLCLVAAVALAVADHVGWAK